MKPSVALILKAYEKFGSISKASTFLQIDDSEVLAALAQASPGFRLSLAEARACDTLLVGLDHLRLRYKKMGARWIGAAVRDMGKLMCDLQAKRSSAGKGDDGLGLSVEEQKRLEETAKELEATSLEDEGIGDSDD